MTQPQNEQHMSTHRKFTFPESLWAGNEQSLMLAMEDYDLLMAGVFSTAVNAGSLVEDDVPYNFNMQGDIGIVSIKGPLVNNDSPYNMYRGVTSYADVRRAMIYAAQSDGVKSILLDIDSGGGAVSGVDDTGNLISSIDKGIKPVYAYTGGNMMSAAYWLGVSARDIYVAQTALVGSIGVIATHQEYSKALKAAGIGVTVMRAGQYKALANSAEVLSPEAQAAIEEQLDAAYAVFATYCAKQLGVPMSKFEATMGQGREFFGAAGVTAGLAKGVKSFDGMVSFLEKQIDSSAKKDNTAGNYQRGVPMSRQAMTEQRIAALAAGALPTPEEIAAAAAAATAAATAAIDPVVIAAAAAAAENLVVEAAAAKVITDAAAATALAAAALVAPQAGVESAALVVYLQGQIKEKDAAILAQSIELNGAKAANETMKASHAGLVKIAADSLTNMKIGMGLTKADFSAMAPALLLAEHARTAAAFMAQYPVGGVAALSSAAALTPEAVDPLIAARVAANRYQPKK